MNNIMDNIPILETDLFRIFMRFIPPPEKTGDLDSVVLFTRCEYCPDKTKTAMETAHRSDTFDSKDKDALLYAITEALTSMMIAISVILNGEEPDKNGEIHYDKLIPSRN